MSKKVAIYVRSSKDRNDVSCTAQEEELKKIARDNGEQIYQVFTDKALSSTRDYRPAFDEMLQLALSKNPPFKKIYCLDTSRFGRDHTDSQVLLHKLRKKHGIEVVFSNMPNTGSYLDPAFEAIFQSFDYIHSQQSKVKGVAGMKQNVKNGYRACGKAPYGYKIEEVEVAEHRNGDVIHKTRLVPDPETAKYVIEYFERRAKYETRKSILKDFYKRGIPSPSGKSEWPISSGKSIEDNIDTYLGHTIFNRLNERLKENGKPNGYLEGKKYKDKEEWVITENTHDPLVSEEVAKVIREQKAKRMREPNKRAKKCYTLSGTLKCSECGTNFTATQGVYRCNSKTKPGLKCKNNDISQAIAEQVIISFINDQLLNFKNLKPVIDRLKEKLNDGGPNLSPYEKNLKKIEEEKQRLVDLYKKGHLEVEEIETDLEDIKKRREATLQEIENLKLQSNTVMVSDAQIKEAIEDFENKVHQADPEIKKRAIQTLFDEVRIFPKKGTPWERLFEIKGAGLPLTYIKMASPRGFEPLSPA